MICFPNNLVGTITTNNVLEDSLKFRVLIDRNKKLDAKLITTIPEKNLAVLLINPDKLLGRKAIQIVDPDTAININDNIFTINLQPGGEKVLVNGKVTNTGDSNIITDIDISYNNAGSPLLNSDGKVIGVNSYILLANKPDSPEIKVIPAKDILAALDKAKQIINDQEIKPPSTDLIPVLTDEVFPTEDLKNALNKRYSLRNYTYNVGPFKIIVFSPPLYYNVVSKNKLEKYEIKRKKRKNKKKSTSKIDIPAINPQSTFAQTKYWTKKPDKFKPLLIVKAIPKTGQTSGSSARGWASFLLGEAIGIPVYLGSKTLEFKDDFYNMELLVNGVPIKPIKRGRELNQALYYEYFKNLNTKSHSGLFYYDPHILISNNPSKVNNIEIKVYKVSDK